MANQPLPRDTAFSEKAVGELEGFIEFIEGVEVLPEDFPRLFVGFVGGFDGLGFYSSLHDAVLQHCTPGSLIEMIGQVDAVYLHTRYAGWWIIGVLSDVANEQPDGVVQVLIARFHDFDHSTKRLALVLIGNLCQQQDTDAIAALADGETDEVAFIVSKILDRLSDH